MRDHSFTIHTLHHFFCFHVGILTCMSSWGSAIWVLSAFRASNLMNFFIFLFVFLMMINSLLFICFSWNTASTTAEFIYRTSSKREDKKKKNQKKEKLKTKNTKAWSVTGAWWCLVHARLFSWSWLVRISLHIGSESQWFLLRVWGGDCEKDGGKVRPLIYRLCLEMELTKL